MKNKKIMWITQTAVMLALLIVLQAVTKPLGQLVTGSCVNAVLAITVLFCGLSSGITVALLSPVFAYVLGIAPQLLTVPAIMAGNAVYVLALHLIAGKANALPRMIAGWLVAAGTKFAVMYTLVAWLICDVLAEKLLESGILKAPMLTVLTTNFTWPQLITALIGGAIAMAIVPALKKGLKR